jgi:hypothetical protein
MKNPILALGVASALVLSACGGGGGGSGTATTTPPVSTLSTITAVNSNKVAGNAYAATASINESTSLTDILTGVSMGPANISTVSPVLNLVKRAYGQGAPQLLTGVTITEACSGGGTVTIDANLRNSQSLSNGDTMTMTANNCVEDGDLLKGAMTITFSGVTGDILNTFSGAATLDTRFTGFSVTSGSDTIGVNGDMKIAMTVTSPTSNSVTISGTSLQTTEQKAGATVATRTLTDYSLTGSTNGATVTSAANFALSGNAGSLGQFSFTVKNLKPFVTVGSAMPSSGALIVNGAASSVTVTVVNATSVRLDFSAKGDGTITQTTTMNWADFIASI